jgi:SAM-dependent methyltransferase
MTTVALRRPWQGVLEIFDFNRRFYLGTIAGVGAALCALPFLPEPARAAILSGAGLALYWSIASLAVSHYVYDRYPLYDLRWIRGELGRAPKRWINVHCGLDETSEVLAAIFPEAEGRIVDIFDPQTMTEPSIRRAHEIARNAAPAVRACYHDLPFSDGFFDAAFAFFAAHELRRHGERVRFFAEIERILARDGMFFLIEHGRDWPSFLAFGPGFLHFFSHGAWRRAVAEAGLRLENEFPRTPFVRVYVFRRVR